MIRLCPVSSALLILACAPHWLIAQPDFARRVANIEAVTQAYYHGELLDERRERMNRQVEEFNAKLGDVKRASAAQKPALDALSAEVARLRQEVEDLDRKLKKVPSADDHAGVEAYNRLVEARRSVVERHNAAVERLNIAVKDYNAEVQRETEASRNARARLDASLAADKAWLDAFDAFEKRGDDRVLATAVNRLLSELRRAEREGRGQAAMLTRVRRVRRELGARAMLMHARQENGTIVIEAIVGDEPCWYLLDTGASNTTISAELVEALGLAGSLGDETTMVVADGRRVKGRTLTLSSVTVSRVTEQNVKAALLPVSDVGIDGLLGQTFLKRFVYTVDERRAEKLVLTRR